MRWHPLKSGRIKSKRATIPYKDVKFRFEIAELRWENVRVLCRNETGASGEGIGDGPGGITLVVNSLPKIIPSEPFSRYDRERSVRVGRRPAGLSGRPSSEPCTAGDGGRLLQCGPSACETCSEDEPLFRCCPTQFRRRSCASEGWAVPAAPLHRRRVGRVGLPGREPFSRVFQWPERYGHFPRGRYSSGAVRCAFRCPLGKTSFLRVEREDDHR